MNDLVACAVMLVEASSLVETMTEVGVVNTGSVKSCTACMRLRKPSGRKELSRQ